MSREVALGYEFPMLTPGSYTAHVVYRVDGKYVGQVEEGQASIDLPYAGTLTSSLVFTVLPLNEEMRSQFDQLRFTPLPPSSVGDAELYVNGFCGAMVESNVIKVAHQHPEFYFSPFWIRWQPTAPADPPE
jgi:hypothetical protein